MRYLRTYYVRVLLQVSFTTAPFPLYEYRLRSAPCSPGTLSTSHSIIRTAARDNLLLLLYCPPCYVLATIGSAGGHVHTALPGLGKWVRGKDTSVRVQHLWYWYFTWSVLGTEAPKPILGSVGYSITDRRMCVGYRFYDAHNNRNRNRNRNRELYGRLFGRLFRMNGFFTPCLQPFLETPFPPRHFRARVGRQAVRCCAARHESMVISVRLTGEQAESINDKKKTHVARRQAESACSSQYEMDEGFLNLSTLDTQKIIARGSVLLRGRKMK